MFYGSFEMVKGSCFIVSLSMIQFLNWQTFCCVRFESSFSFNVKILLLLSQCIVVLFKVFFFPCLLQARGLKKHLKRLNAPRHWMLDKLGGAFVCYHLEPFCFLTSLMLLPFNSVFLIIVHAGTQAILWTPQVQGMLATYSHSAKQIKVCSNIQRSDCHSYAKACYGRWEG